MIAKTELSLTCFKVDCFYARRLFCEDNIKKEWLILRHFNQESKDSSCLDSSKKMMFFWPKKTVVLMLSWKYLNLIWARFWIWTRHKRSPRAILWNVISVDDIISYSRYIHFKQRSMERDDRDGLSWLYQKLTQKRWRTKRNQKFLSNESTFGRLSIEKSSRSENDSNEDSILMLLIVIIFSHFWIQPNHILGFYYDY